MPRQNIALIDKSKSLHAAELKAVSDALTVQANRDLKKFWPKTDASVIVLSAHAKVPTGVMPVYIGADLPEGKAGSHKDDTGTPYAIVALGDGWQIATSHEVCEMLVDPTLHLTQTAPAVQVVHGKIRDAPGTFEYLVEVCDPSESPDHGYLIDRIPVSDFYTPHFFDAARSAGTQYSFTRALTAPRRVLQGGYLSWHNPTLKVWQTLIWHHDEKPIIKTVDWTPPGGGKMSREHIDQHMGTTKHLSATHRDHPLLRRARGEKD